MDIGFRIVSTPAPNENWRYVWFGPIESSAASDSTNPDHDGLVNLRERAFNLNPNQPALPILSEFFKSS